ncbi:MAG TPA: hypothetical protein VM387_00880 [Gemmatimonadales bacterium]|nr:hypothetical protein [Gemmatimonadales bacterium]
MASGHGTAEPSPAERLEAVLGGTPLPASGPVPGEHDKQASRRRKLEAKRRRDAERPPESFERFRILSELVDQGRQVIELADHRARYALVVMSVLNAFVFLVISRSHLLGELPPASRTWLIGFIGLYGVVTFIFVFYTVDCLRPRPLRYGKLLGDGREGRPGPLGILYWETIAGYDLESYRRAWSEARMDQLNAEVVIIAHSLAGVVRAKYHDLGRLYWGLAGLVVLACALLVVLTVFGLTA